ncbi:MAG TPA: GNAT family N-acetyltransferase [Propionibacteriaceae bacterium]
MSYAIRPAGTGDWAEAREIRLRALQEAPTAYGSSYAREITFTEQDWRERLATAYTYLASGPDGAVVGTVTGVWMQDGDVYLVAMYVAPTARGGGLAHALIDKVVGVTARRAGSRVVLRVTEGNDTAERCYRRYGFRPTGRRITGETALGLTEQEFAYAVGKAETVGAGD